MTKEDPGAGRWGAEGREPPGLRTAGGGPEPRNEVSVGTCASSVVPRSTVETSRANNILQPTKVYHFYKTRLFKRTMSLVRLIVPKVVHRNGVGFVCSSRTVHTGGARPKSPVTEGSGSGTGG